MWGRQSACSRGTPSRAFLGGSTIHKIWLKLVLTGFSGPGRVVSPFRFLGQSVPIFISPIFLFSDFPFDLWKAFQPLGNPQPDNMGHAITWQQRTPIVVMAFCRGTLEDSGF
jgi:hypothetical protein